MGSGERIFASEAAASVCGSFLSVIMSWLQYPECPFEVYKFCLLSLAVLDRDCKLFSLRYFIENIAPHTVADIETAFKRGKQRFMEDTGLTAGGLYDYVSGLAKEAGWEFAAPTAGHLVGHFPHETAPGDQPRFSIRHGNPINLREPDAKGEPRHWILEIHFADAARTFGGFCEELLTI